MANVLLTETCVRSCPYCFAKQYMTEADVQDSLSWGNLIYIADLLESSGEKHISLLGGEPLLHPQIAEFVNYLNIRGFFVTIFTSGIMPDEKFEGFAKKLLSRGEELKLGFVCNVNEPRFSPKSEIEKVKRFFSAFGERCSLSFNIYRLDFNMDFLLSYIIEYGLGRHIRLGLAHPIPEAKNKFISPHNFDKVKNTLMDAFEKMSELAIVPGFDCGFPMCMFTDEELGKVFKYSLGQISFQCGPAIDIGTDLSCWSCFPLSNFYKKSLFDFNNLREIHDFFESKMQEVRREVKGLYPECDNCDNNKHGICSGGCLAHILNNFNAEGNIR